MNKIKLKNLMIKWLYDYKWTKLKENKTTHTGCYWESIDYLLPHQFSLKSAKWKSQTDFDTH